MMIFRDNVSTMDQSGIQSLAPLVKKPEDPGYEIDHDFFSLKTGIAQLNKHTVRGNIKMTVCIDSSF